MMTLVLALLLHVQGQEQEFVGPPRQPMYRWKDRAGQLHVTTTAPPANAIILEILTPGSAAERNDEGEEEGAAPITPEEFRTQMESVLGQGVIDYWRGIDKSFHDARLSGNADESIRTVDAALSGALWGDKFWAILMLPLAAVAICLLLAWWLCKGLSKKLVRTLIWTAFGLTGLLLSHVGLQGLLYRAQAMRMDFMLSMMPHYLGGHIEVSPDNKQAIRRHADALPGAASPLLPPWAFPLEIHRVRQTLRRVALEAEPFNYEKVEAEPVETEPDIEQ